MPVPLADIRAFLLDLDGTIYLGPTPIPGAPEFIAFLKSTGRKHLFFTNNPSSDATAYAKKLCAMGIPAEPGDILTSGEATARYLAGQTSYRRLFVLGTPSFEAELQRHGLEVVTAKPDAVVLSFDKTLTYAKLEAAALFLAKGLPYIATNPDAVCPTEYGYIPDCGAMAALLEKATGRVPQYIGKPNAEMVAMGLEKLGVTADQTAMVGDRLYTDMEMGRRAGITRILVLSGETKEGDIPSGERRPDYIIESVASIRALIDA